MCDATCETIIAAAYDNGADSVFSTDFGVSWSVAPQQDYEEWSAAVDYDGQVMGTTVDYERHTLFRVSRSAILHAAVVKPLWEAGSMCFSRPCNAVIQTTNSGQNWNDISSSIRSLLHTNEDLMYSLAVTKDGQTWFIATGTHGSQGAGVYKSTNAGTTFTAAPGITPTTCYEFMQVAVSGNGNYVFVISQSFTDPDRVGSIW